MCTIANQTEYAQFTSCLPMVSGSLSLPPPLKRVVMIEHIEKSIKIILIKKNVLFLVGLYDEHAFGLCNCLNA
jgi:hypothetical protein